MKKFIAVLLIALIPAQLLAWGPKGHAIVADIAASRLTPTAKQNLQLLLGADSLASIASWADSVRKERDESYDWHFVDIPKDAPGFSEERDCFRPQDKHKDALTDHHNCVVDRIEMFQKILGDEKASRADRLEALKWLVHFVGDLHQPLHAIDEARGGNDIKLAVFGITQVWRLRLQSPLGMGHAAAGAYWLLRRRIRWPVERLDRAETPGKSGRRNAGGLGQ